ncbi:MAG: type VI secretion system-associated protein TagF [Caulobacteraceae bacterium]|nr:MAG: type VI secretion system-associated protein TagF [Caulobacteraceae bacterium]
MPSDQTMTGYFGKLPSAAGFLVASLPQDFTDRWDTWYAAATRETPPPPIAYDEPAWRFVAAPGLFGPLPAAGVWRHSQDVRKGRYPFVIATLGHPLAVDDPWFDAAERLLTSAVDGETTAPDLALRLPRLPIPRPAAPPSAAILMWRDDWEVHELSFPTGRAFAAFGLPQGSD